MVIVENNVDSLTDLVSSFFFLCQHIPVHYEISHIISFDFLFFYSQKQMRRGQHTRETVLYSYGAINFFFKSMWISQDVNFIRQYVAAAAIHAVCFILCIYSLVFLDYQKYYLLLIMNYSIITPCLSLSIATVYMCLKLYNLK